MEFFVYPLDLSFSGALHIVSPVSSTVKTNSVVFLPVEAKGQ